MQIRENISLKPYHTFGINVSAKYFASFTSIEQLIELLNNPKPETPNPKLILGGGSNVLFLKDYNGLVMKNEISGIEVVYEDGEHIYVKAGAGWINITAVVAF